MQQWVHLAGGDQVTNYIHMLGSMHVTYYIRRFGQLYRFSQQGWEAVNAKIKSCYFKNTNRGGCCGKKTVGDHLLPVMRMCVRHIMWTTGVAQDYFEKKDAERYEKKKAKFMEKFWS